MSSKNPAAMGGNNVLAAAYNAADESLSTSSFVTAVVGRKITITNPSSTIQHITHAQNATTLYVLEITFDNPAHDNVVSVERIS